MNTLLCSYLSAHTTDDTLFVLWGFSPEDAGLSRPSLDVLLQQRLSRYLSSLLQQNPCVITAEEFALHADTLAQEFPRIILVQNACYRTLLPVSVELTPEMQSGLLSHFDPDAPQDAPLPGIEPCLRVYSNLLRTEEGIACCISLDDLLRQYPQVERISLGTAPQAVPEAGASNSAFALTGETDYFCLVQQLQRREMLCVSADSFIGDEADLADSLAALAGAFPGQLSRVHAQTMQPERTVCPEARTLLQQHWGYPDFLPLEVYDLDALHRGEKKLRTITQEDIIDDLIQQAELCRKGQTYRDLFVTASTGAGKSVMFQIPAIDLAEKYGMVTLVISPLIGLMNDQVQGMEKHRYAKARTINSDIPPMVKKTIAQEVQEGRCDILYLSPESLLSRSDISDLIGDRAIGLLIVDEAHIVTTWGKQFRPDYWFLGDYVNKLRKQQLNGPHHHAFVTATFTATATYGGEEDMYRETLRSLHMSPDPIVYLGCMHRHNIELCIREVPRVTGRREYELDKFQALTGQLTSALDQGQKTLVYFPTVSLLERFYTHCLAQRLGNAMTRYHAQLSGEAKAENLEDFRSGKRRVMRPSPLFTHGYFLLSSDDAAAVNRICTGAATLQDESAGVYNVDLARLWSTRWQNDFSFPQFKYLLYTHSDKLPLNAQLHLTPAMQLTLEWHTNADTRFAVLLHALKEIFFDAARSDQYLYDRDAAARLVQATGLSSSRAVSTVRVVLAAVQSWQQHSPRLQRTRVLRRGTTQEGTEYSIVDPFISEFFHWLEQSFSVLHGGEPCRYLPVDDSSQGSERLTPALGVLEELDLLHFALLGGSNSRLYLYINQTQTLELADRGFYRNHLLERVAQRHTDAVRLMSWLFTSGFSSEQLWDHIEEYFLGLPIQGFDAAPATSAESR